MVLYAPIIGIGGILKVVNTKTGMGWIIVVAVVAIFVLVGILVVVAMPKFKQMQTLVDRMNLVSREILTGIPVIRAFSREKFEEKRFEKANRDLMQTQLFTNRVMTFMMPTMMLMSVAYDKPRMFMLTNVSTPIIAESRIFPAKKPPKLRFASWQIRRVVSAALFGRNARVSTRAWRSSLSFCRRR